MKRALTAGIGLLALAAVPAAAADIPVKAPYVTPVMAPAFSWTGCYVGGFVGGAWGGRDASAQDLDGYNYGGLPGPAWGYKLGSSFIGGGTLGCNYQTGQFVLGLEGEAGYIKLRGSAFDPNSPFLPLDTEASTKIGDWYGIVAGRAGFAWDRALLYVKGGVAFVDVKFSAIDANPVGGNTIATNGGKVEATWALGGGIEYALSEAWSLKGEYMFLGLKRSETTCGAATVGGGAFCWGHEANGIHTAKIGLNYRFGGGPIIARY